MTSAARRARTVALAGGVTLMLAGCSGSLLARQNSNSARVVESITTTLGTTTTGSAGPSPASLVLAAARKLAAPAGYSMSYVSRVRSTGLVVKGSGSFNFVTRQTSQIITSGGANIPADQSGKPVRAVASGKLLYVLYPPDIRDRFTRPWLSFTAKQYNHALGNNGGLEAIKAPFYYGSAGLGGELAGYLERAANSFTRVGAASIRGVSTTHYVGRLKAVTLEVTTRTHKTVLARVKEVDLNVWLDAEDRVRRVDFSSPSSQDITAEDLVITSYTVPSRIAPPPAAQVVNYAKAAR